MLIHQLIWLGIVCSTLISAETITDEFGCEYSEESLMRAYEFLTHEEYMDVCYGSSTDNGETVGVLIGSEPNIAELLEHQKSFTKAYDFVNHKSRWSDVELANFVAWSDKISQQLREYRKLNDFTEVRKRVKKYCTAILKLFHTMLAVGYNSGYKNGFRGTPFKWLIFPWTLPLAYKLHKATDFKHHFASLTRGISKNKPESQFKPSPTIVDALMENNRPLSNEDIGPAPPYQHPPSYDDNQPNSDTENKKGIFNKLQKITNMSQHKDKIKRGLSKLKFKQNSPFVAKF